MGRGWVGVVGSREWVGGGPGVGGLVDDGGRDPGVGRDGGGLWGGAAPGVVGLHRWGRLSGGPGVGR